MAKVYGYEIDESTEQGSVVIIQENPMDHDSVVLLTIHQIPSFIQDLKNFYDSHCEEE